MHNKVPGIGWFIHTMVKRDLESRGAIMNKSTRNGVELWTSQWGVLAVTDYIPIDYNGRSQTYSGGWSQTIDIKAPTYKLLTRG